MGIPIRWDNIHGPDFRTAAGILGQSQASMNTAISGIGNIFQGMNNLEQENWNTGKTNNTGAFMRQLMGYKTPEEYQAAMQAGVLNDQLTGYGAQVDSDAALKAMDRRLVTLQQRDLTDMQYQGSKLDNQQAPIRDSIARKIALGQIPAAMAELEANPGLRNTAPLAQAADARTWLGKERGQQETVWSDTNKLAPYQLSVLKAKAALLEAQAEDPDLTELSGSRSGVGKGKKGESTVEMTPAEAEAALRRLTAVNNGPAGKGNLEPLNNLDSVTKFVDDNIKTPKEAEAVKRAVSLTGTNGIPIENGKVLYPTQSMIEAAVLRSKDSSWWGDSNRGDSFISALKEMAKDPRFAEAIAIRQEIENTKPSSLFEQRKLVKKELSGKVKGANDSKEEEESTVEKLNGQRTKAQQIKRARDLFQGLLAED